MAKNKRSTQNVSDVEYQLKPKPSALAINMLYGKDGHERFEAPKQKWEDLEEIFQAAAKGIVETAQNINAALAVPGVKENVSDVNELNVSVKGLTRDLQCFAENLATVHKRHEGKSGFIKEASDHTECLGIFEDYVNFDTQFKSVTLPTVLTIMDHIGTACNKLAEQHRNTVIDGSDTDQDNTDAGIVDSIEPGIVAPGSTAIH